MKTNFSFLKNTTQIFFLATVTLLLFSARSTTFAGDATWDSSGSTAWNLDGNWTPTSGYPGSSGTTDTATFDNFSSTTSLFISSVITIAVIDFTGLETHGFTITVDPSVSLTISVIGIANGSGVGQTFVTAVDAGGGEGAIVFNNSATAGTGTSFSNTGSGFSGAFGGFTQFNNTSTAGSGIFENHASVTIGADGGFTVFNNSATAGSGTFYNSGTSISGAGSGFTDFSGVDATHFSTAGSGTFNNLAGTASSGFTRFFSFASAASGTFNNNGGTASSVFGGHTEFNDSSAAGSGTFTNNGGTVNGAYGGVTQFNDSSTAGSGTFTNNAGTV